MLAQELHWAGFVLACPMIATESITMQMLTDHVNVTCIT